MIYEVTVEGTPIPQGSMVCVGAVGSKRHQLKHSNDVKLRGWRDSIRARVCELQRVIDFTLPLDEPVNVYYEFVFASPQRKRFSEHAVKPDLDKLVRAVNDAITGITPNFLLREDSRVNRIYASKRYAGADEKPHLIIRVETLGEY